MNHSHFPGLVFTVYTGSDRWPPGDDLIASGNLAGFAGKHSGATAKPGTSRGISGQRRKI